MATFVIPKPWEGQKDEPLPFFLEGTFDGVVETTTLFASCRCGWRAMAECRIGQEGAEKQGIFEQHWEESPGCNCIPTVTW
jgi:hypothetical protein